MHYTLNSVLSLLNHIEYSVIEHVKIVGIDTFRDEGFAVVVFDLLGTMYLHEDEVGI